jgi:hypothetical protein
LPIVAPCILLDPFGENFELLPFLRRQVSRSLGMKIDELEAKELMTPVFPLEVALVPVKKLLDLNRYTKKGSRNAGDNNYATYGNGFLATRSMTSYSNRIVRSSNRSKWVRLIWALSEHKLASFRFGYAKCFGWTFYFSIFV